MIDLQLTLPLERFALQIELQLSSGATVVCGPSGAGKTSLLESIAGLRRESRGRIVVEGEVLLDSQRGLCLPPQRRKVGYVPQEAALFPHLTVRQNVRFGVGATERSLAPLIDLLDLQPLMSRFPATLSGGEKMRVAIARALAPSPRLLLLDEPLGGFDLERKQRFAPYLLHVRDELHCPFFYVTHNQREAKLFGLEVVLLDEGRAQAVGRPADLLHTSSDGTDL